MTPQTKEILAKGRENQLRRRITIDPLFRETKSIAELIASEIIESRMGEMKADLALLIEKMIPRKEDLIGPKGDSIKGEPGKSVEGPPGPPGPPGKNYIPTEEDKRQIASFIQPVERVVIRTETIREIPIVTEKVTQEIKEVAKYESAEVIAEKLNTLKGAVDLTVISGLDAFLDHLQKIAQSKGKPRGGGDIVVAGTGITITRLSDGTREISATASGGANIATERLTGTQVGDNVTLDLTALAHTFSTILLVLRNGDVQTPTDDWTRVANTITVNNANAGGVFLIQYSYA